MKRSLQALFALALLLQGAPASFSAERPTMNVTCDPRPDILAHPFYYAHTEYRRAYNRPRFLSGWLVAQIEPTSQEAMVWYENLQAGRYDKKHMPPVYKTYCYPKPWEALQTGPRPDFSKPKTTPAKIQADSKAEAIEPLDELVEPIPMELQDSE